MGSKYPVLKPSEIISALNQFGFRVVSQKGSHIKLRKEGLVIKTVIVPNHYELAKARSRAYLSRQELI